MPDVELKVLIYADEEDILLPAADVIRNAFNGRATISKIKPNNKGDGYHLFLSVFVKGGSQR